MRPGRHPFLTPGTMLSGQKIITAWVPHPREIAGLDRSSSPGPQDARSTEIKPGAPSSFQYNITPPAVIHIVAGEVVSTKTGGVKGEAATRLHNIISPPTRGDRGVPASSQNNILSLDASDATAGGLVETNEDIETGSTGVPQYTVPARGRNSIAPAMHKA